MIPLVVFIVFIGGLVIGSLIANGMGRLPSAEQLELEDRTRLRKLDEELMG